MRFQKTLAFIILDLFKKAGTASSRFNFSLNPVVLTPPNWSGTAPSAPTSMIFYKKENKTSNFRKIVSFVPILFAILINATNLHADAKSWTGNVSNQWDNASNWSPTSLPSSGDDITISTVASGRYPILSTGTYCIAILKIQSPGTLTINNGTLNVNDEITIENGGILNQNGGVLSTQNIELETGGQYNQVSGVLKINKKFKNEGSFISTGGTVEFTGSGNSGSDFASGTTQFFNQKNSSKLASG